MGNRNKKGKWSIKFIRKDAAGDSVMVDAKTTASISYLQKK